FVVLYSPAPHRSLPPFPTRRSSDLAPGSSACINVMEIRPTLTPEMELIDEMDYSDIDSMLARKIQQLMIFFSLLIPDMSNEEEQDRKSTRLNSSHVSISYAVFCLKK